MAIMSDGLDALANGRQRQQPLIDREYFLPTSTKSRPHPRTQQLQRSGMSPVAELTLHLRLSQVVAIRILVLITVLVGAGSALPWIM